jgi:RNA polymerase sigma-70 factor (ECF subfamily)
VGYNKGVTQHFSLSIYDYLDKAISMSNLSELSDKDLVHRAQAGSLEAFNLLYNRYFSKVYQRVSYKIPETDVDDVTQEVLLTMVRSLKKFKHKSKFDTWLRTIINRRIADYYRSKKPVDTETDIQSGNIQFDLQTMEAETSSNKLDEMITLRKALKNLPDHYQEIILLRFVDGLQFKEIAQINSQSLEATKSLYRRSISTLRSYLEDTHD